VRALVVAALVAAACSPRADPPPPPSTGDVFTHAAAARPGAYPKWALRRQTYWTVVGLDRDRAEALVNEEGMVEVAAGAWSLEPFVVVDGRVVTWADVATSHSLADGALPIPTVEWRHDAFTLRMTAFANGDVGRSMLYLRYRLVPAVGAAAPERLLLAVRPLQVLPPWQDLNVAGGLGRLAPLVHRGRALSVGTREVLASQRADAWVPLALEEPSLGSYALAFDVADGARELAVDLVMPMHDDTAPPALPDAADDARAYVDRVLAETTAAWRRRLAHPAIELPPAAGDLAAAMTATLAYVLVHRDGPALQPGSRNYARSWIRDGALTASTLLSFGHLGPVRDFLLWYAGFQFDDGKIPCCIDGRGADPTPEHDSDGEFIYAAAEYWRFTSDRDTVLHLWPHVERAAGHIETLRAARREPAYEGTAAFGLVPESISHEGYHKRPVHSYWDDFFALRGLADAALLAGIAGDEDARLRFEAAHREFRDDLRASLARVVRERRLDYVPGSVELADFDPTSTAIAVTVADAEDVPPRDALLAGFARYHREIVEWRAGRPNREGHTPYEARNAEALVRLGRRDDAYDVLEFVMAGRRPPGWQEWGEVVWADAARPQFIGDMPHTWAAQAVVRTVRTMLVYERERDDTLVVAAGVPSRWLDGGGAVVLRDVPTHYGPLAYRLGRDGSRTTLELSGGLVPPRGGIELAPPLQPGPRVVHVNGAVADAAEDGRVVVRELPATVTWSDGP
jgi:hypothetical protein